MGLVKFKERILSKRIKKRLENNIEVRSVSNEKINSIGVLANNSSTYLDEFVNRLEQELNCKQIQLFLFKPFSKKEIINENQFTDKDVNWRGNFTNQHIIDFLDNPFSLLIGFFADDNLYLKNAVLQSKAGFKVGFSTVEQNLFELVVDSELQNTSEFIDELKKYLVALQKIKI
jgi:hypothetical protein